MKYACIAAICGAASLAFTGLVHAAGPASAPITLAPAPVVAVAAERIATALPAQAMAGAQPGAVHVAVNSFDAARPATRAARAAALQGDAPLQDAAPSYLVSASRYAQDVGSFLNAPATADKMTEAPLPGALWLFGSALLAFLAIAVRRKF